MIDRDSITRVQYNTTELNNQKEKYKGKWIPKELEDLGLSAIEQMLLATIDALDDEEEHCTASNAYLAKRMGISESRISFYITKFKRMELVEQVGYNGRFRVLKSLKYNWYKPKNSKKLYCVNSRSQTTRFHVPYNKDNTATLKDPPPPSSKLKPQKEKPKKPPDPKPKVSLRSEEEDFSDNKTKESPSAKPLYEIGLTIKQVLRIVKKYHYDQVMEALEIFKTQEVKKDIMGLLLNILDNPEKWEKKPKTKTKEDKDREKEEYRKKNK